MNQNNLSGQIVAGQMIDLYIVCNLWSNQCQEVKLVLEILVGLFGLKGKVCRASFFLYENHQIIIDYVVVDDDDDNYVVVDDNDLWFYFFTYISSRFFDNQPNKICSHLSQKASKGRFLKREKLQNHTNEGKGKEKKKSGEKERRRRKKKSNGCTLSFYNRDL